MCTAQSREALYIYKNNNNNFSTNYIFVHLLDNKVF